MDGRLSLALPVSRAAPRASTAYDPVLRWMIFAGVQSFAFYMAWRLGLVRLAVHADRTGLTTAIAALYLAASAHALGRAVVAAREAKALEAWRETGDARPPGAVATFARDLAGKARWGGAAPLDPALLLQALAIRMRRGAALGALFGDILMKLGLLGTIVGFILMLGPVAGLDAEDPDATRLAMATMSGGMATAMYTTLAGLVGALLLRAQHVPLDSAASRTFWEVVRWIETRGHA